ncbi:MAG: hypothetical protein OXF11_22250 [Deltaproteobacteria bacterium]|nr:hypothetical protein [Deltaproteobacteria bacterium]
MNTVTTMVEFLAAIGGLYAVVAEFSDESTALTFLLIIIGTLGAGGLALKINHVGCRAACCAVAVAVGGSLVFYSWINGGPHALSEEVACRLHTDRCVAARIARISQKFKGLARRVFNQHFSESEIEEHRRFCKIETANSASQVALFELSVPIGRTEKIAFSYLLRSAGRWEPKVHSPLTNPDIPGNHAFEGYLDLTDRLKRTNMSIGPHPATMLIRVCGVPSNETGQRNLPADAFWTKLDVYDIRLAPEKVRYSR